MSKSTTVQESLIAPEFHTARAISVNDLVGRLALRAQGVSGPERRNAPQVLVAQNVQELLDPELAEWPEASTVVGSVCTTFNKLIDREGISEATVTSTIMYDVADKISRLATAAGFPDTKQSIEGLTRLIENTDTQTGEYYLSEEFIYDLQDMVGEDQDPELYHTIGNFFTIKELLRRAVNNKNVLQDVRESVEKAADILQDPTIYIERVTGTIADPGFVRHLTPVATLYLTSRFPGSADFAIGQVAQYYEKLASAYPRAIEADGRLVFELLLHSGTSAATFEKIDEKVAGIDSQLMQAYASGFTDSRSKRTIARNAQGDPLKYRKALLIAREQEALDNRRSPYNGPMARRARAVDEKGIVPLAAFGVIEQDLAYRDLLFDISDVASPEKHTAILRDVFESVEAIRANAQVFAGGLPRDTAENREYAEAIEGALQKRVVEIIGLVPGLIGGATQRGTLYYGEHAVKDLEVSTMQDVINSLHLFNFMLTKLNADQTGRFSESTILAREGVGRFVGHNQGTSVIIRPQATENGEARIGWTVSITPEEQRMILGYAVTEKPTKLSLRLDLERATGGLSLDIGGLHELHAQTQPLNALLARTLTVGSQQIAIRLGIVPQKADYHVREVFTPEMADQLAFRRFANNLMYQLSLTDSAAR